jgi:hypothetical protein
VRPERCPSVQGAQVVWDIYGVFAQRVQRDDLKGPAVGGCEHDRRSRPIKVGLKPARGDDTPPVAGDQPGEAELGTRRGQVVADRTLVLQELARGDRAHGMQSNVLGPAITITRAVEARDRVGSAGLERTTQDIQFAHTSIVHRPARRLTFMASVRRSHLRAAGCATAVALGLAACGAAPNTADSYPKPLRSIYVNPATGADANDGSTSRPLQSIQAALDQATPGTQINLAPGRYRERITTQVNGTAKHPIVLRGPETGTSKAGRYRATVIDTSRVVNINNSHYVLDGFTVDGQEQLLDTAYPTDLSRISDFKRSARDKIVDSKLIYIGSADTSSGVTDVTIRNMFLNGSGGECVRLRNGAHGNTITESVIQYCGMFGKSVGKSDTEFHNGEGVYIGTSPGSDDQPMHANDAGSRNVVKRNVIRTFGTECLDVKENAHDNLFEDNTCSDNTEPTKDGGSLVELRGYNNVVRNNRLSNSLGYGVKIRSDKSQYDKGGNVVTGNRISNTAGKSIFIKSDAQQGKIQ